MFQDLVFPAGQPVDSRFRFDSYRATWYWRAVTEIGGERFESTLGDSLQHGVLHGAYHRGQIAADVRAAGGEPAYTDFIHAAREGIV